METTAYIKHLRISPKKLRFLLKDIKAQSPQNALEILSQSQSRGAKLFYKAIKSALTSVISQYGDDSNVKFKTLLVEQGTALRRMRPASRGRANFYKKRSSHIKVVLEKTPKKEGTDVKLLRKQSAETKTAEKAVKKVKKITKK